MLVRPDALRGRRAAQAKAFERAREVHELLERARNEPLGEPTVTMEHAERWVAEIRADRDR